MRLSITPRAQRDIRALPQSVVLRVRQAVAALGSEPRPSGCLLLRDVRPPVWRVRVGDWRILYRIDDAAHVVTVVRVLHRSRAYEP